MIKLYKSKKDMLEYSENDIGEKITRWAANTYINQNKLYKHKYYITNHELTKEEIIKYQ